MSGQPASMDLGSGSAKQFPPGVAPLWASGRRSLANLRSSACSDVPGDQCRDIGRDAVSVGAPRAAGAVPGPPARPGWDPTFLRRGGRAGIGIRLRAACSAGPKHGGRGRTTCRRSRRISASLDALLPVSSPSQRTTARTTRYSSRSVTHRRSCPTARGGERAGETVRTSFRHPQGERAI